MTDHEVVTVEPTPAAQAAFVADVERRTRGTVWTSGGCDSWYLDANGPQLHAVARLHVRVLGAHPPGAPRRLPGHRLMSAGPAVRSLGQVPATPLGPGVTATELLNDDHGCRGLHQRRLGFAGAAQLAGTAGGRGKRGT